MQEGHRETPVFKRGSSSPDCDEVIADRIQKAKADTR